MPISRRGFSLIELLVVAALTTLVLSSLTVALHMLFRVDRQMRSELAYAAVLPRLATQWRADAHRALEVQEGSAMEGARTLVLWHGGTIQVEYRAGKRGLVRRLLRDDRVLHTESFPLAGAAVSWRRVGQASLIRLRIERPAPSVGATTEPRRIDEIDAAVGLDFAVARPSPQ